MEEALKIIIQGFREQLNAVNQKFAEQITKNTAISNAYKKIGDSYQRIVERIKEFPQQTYFEIFRLSAELGLLQCHLNAFELSPVTEESVKENDNLLTTLSLQSQKLLILINDLDEKNLSVKKNSVLYKEYLILKKQMEDHDKDKKKIEFNLKSAYYYNYACHLLKTPTSSRLIEIAIEYLIKSSYCYAQNNRKVAQLQTDEKISKAKELLKNFQSLRPVRINIKKLIPSDIQTITTSESPIINSLETLIPDNSKRVSHSSASALAVHIHSLETKNGLIISKIKGSKRRIDTSKDFFSDSNEFISNTSKRMSSDISEKKMPKKIKTHLTSYSSQVDVEFYSNADEVILTLKKEIFSAITEKLVINNPYSFTDFYVYLFHYLAYNINSKLEGKSLQDQFTCLRLSELVLHLIQLSENFISYDLLSPLQIQLNEINKMYVEMAKLYTPPYRRKRLDLKKMMSCESDLKSLFVKEMEDYYLGQNFTNNNARKIFLNELQHIVEKSILTAHKSIITNHTLEVIANQINNLPIKSHHHCLTNSLQVVKEFYMTSDKTQQDCLEASGIPIKSSNIHYQDFLGKLYDLINLFSPQSVERIEFLSGIPKLYFFQPKKKLLTKEVFLARLRNHLLMLKNVYIRSNDKYSIICSNLTQLITNQITQEIVEKQNNVSNSPSYT